MTAARVTGPIGHRSASRAKAAATGPLVAAALSIAALSIAAPAHAADADHGAALFGQCIACHGERGAGTDRGPSLIGVIGRPAGRVPGFPYSRAMQQSPIVWNDDKLSDYLVDPQQVVPGNRMPFAGFETKDDGLDVVAYIKRLETKVSQ